MSLLHKTYQLPTVFAFAGRPGFSIIRTQPFTMIPPYFVCLHLKYFRSFSSSTVLIGMICIEFWSFVFGGIKNILDCHVRSIISYKNCRMKLLLSNYVNQNNRSTIIAIQVSVWNFSYLFRSAQKHYVTSDTSPTISCSTLSVELAVLMARQMQSWEQGLHTSNIQRSLSPQDLLRYAAFLNTRWKGVLAVLQKQE